MCIFYINTKYKYKKIYNLIKLVHCKDLKSNYLIDLNSCALHILKFNPIYGHACTHQPMRIEGEHGTHTNPRQSSTNN